MFALLPKLIVFVGSLCLLSGIFLPTMTVASYVIVRPLIQPFAWLQYKLFGLPIALPFTIIVIALGLIFPVIKGRWSLIVERSSLFVLFIAIAFCSLGVSDYVNESIAALAKLLTVWFLYNIAYNSVKSKKDALRIIDALIIASVIPLLLGFYQAITGNYDLIYSAEVKRISSVFATGNDYGIFLTFITAASAVRLGTATTRKTQILMLVILLMILVSQVLSLNRGTWLALIIGFIVAAIKYRKFINFKLMFAGVMVFILIFSGKIIERFQELQDPGAVHYSRVSTLDARLAYWKALVPVIMERPILGHGIGSSALVAQERFGELHKPHNDYLHVFLEIGVFGVLAYIAFLGRVFFYFFMRKVTKNLWVWNFAMLMLSVYFIVISGAQNIVQSIMNFPIFMIFLAVVFKLNRISKVDDDTAAVKKGAGFEPGPGGILRARVTGKV